MINQAQAYESEVVNRAKGDTDRFLSIYNSYKVDPDVTRSRIYLETMEKVLSNVNKVIICLLYTSPSPRDRQKSRMPSSA